MQRPTAANTAPPAVSALWLLHHLQSSAIRKTIHVGNKFDIGNWYCKELLLDQALPPRNQTNELKLGSFRGVGGTAIFKRNMSPPLGRKLLTKETPAAGGFHFFPVASWWGITLGTPVWKAGHKSTDLGMPGAGNSKVPNTASSKKSGAGQSRDCL